MSELDQLLAVASIPPVVDQVQFSPLAYRRALLESSQARGIVVEAYSPLGTGRNLSNDVVKRIARNVGRTPAQVLLRWCLQRDTVVLTKSTHREHIQENAAVFDFSLSDDDWPRSVWIELVERPKRWNTRGGEIERFPV